MKKTKAIINIRKNKVLEERKVVLKILHHSAVWSYIVKRAAK